MTMDMEWWAFLAGIFGSVLMVSVAVWVDLTRYRRRLRENHREQADLWQRMVDNAESVRLPANENAHGR